MTGGGDGGGQTVVTQSANPPQLIPEGKAGYEQAQEFFGKVLQQPPIFPGPRLAPPSPYQFSAIEQAGTGFGAPGLSEQMLDPQIATTLAGGYLGGPEAQAAVASLADPIFSRFYGETLPGIRDRYQLAGQGLTSSRRLFDENAAITELGRGLGSGVVAPIFTSERERMMDAARLAPAVPLATATRLQGLESAGTAERALGQQEIDVSRQAYEEPLFRQAGAAEALAGMAGTGAGGFTQTQRESPGIMGTIGGVTDAASSVATTALMLSMLAKR